MMYTAMVTKIFFCIGGVFTIISIIDLFCYIGSMKFPICTLRIFAKIGNESDKSTPMTCAKFFRGLINAIEWIYIAIACGFILFYFGLLVQWTLLGAILNPTAYLIYATSAGTFVTFLSVKYA